MKIDHRALLTGTALALVLGWSSGSWAQVSSSLAGADQNPSNFVRDRNLTVLQRPREGYEAIGARAGAFMIYPQVTAGVEYDSNIFALETAEVEDTILRVRPQVSVNSTWSRHEVTAYARASIRRYEQFDGEDSEEWSTGVSGRLDILSSANISAAASHEHLVEPRTSTNTPQASIRPIEYDADQLSLGGVREFNRVKLSTRLDWRALDYGDGVTALNTPIEQDDRDRDNYSITARADYALSPDTAVFVQIGANKRDYDLAPPAVIAARDSKGVEVLAGASFELSALVRGEIGAGYISQSYDAPGFQDIHGYGARAQVEWFPTQLTTVTINAVRSIEDSGLTGSAGYVSSTVGVRADHELLRNVIITAQASYANDDYKDIAREDKRMNLGISGTYLLNRHVGLTVSYSHFDQDSDAIGSNFKINRVGAAITLQF